MSKPKSKEEVKRELKDSVNDFKDIWSNMYFHKKVEFLICLPFFIARDLSRKIWKFLTKPMF